MSRVARSAWVGLSVVLVLCLASRAFAQPAQLVKVVCTGGTPFGTGPVQPVDLGGNLLFATKPCQPGTGDTLWRSDGTSVGTVALKTFASIDSPLVTWKGRAYFAADDATNGSELWATDGTTAGTVLVRDIASGVTSASPSGFTVLGNLLVFVAFDPALGRELWKTDGTQAGTQLLFEIEPGLGASVPTGLVALPGAVVFSAQTSDSGAELWKTDGTAAGTKQVADINVGPPSSAPTSLVVAGAKVFFRASDGTTMKVFSSDGNTVVAAGAVMAFDGAFALGNNVLFRDLDADTGVELWRSDGTVGGTARLADLVIGAGSSYPAFLAPLSASVALFTADAGQGTELWRTDGTLGGTTLVSDINPGQPGSYPSNGVPFAGAVYFSASTAAQGRELWKTDGAVAGTVLVQDIVPGVGSAQVTNLAVAGPRLYFGVTNGTSNELWAITVCPADQHQCGSRCLPATSLDGCGTSCTPCPTPRPGYVATCDGVSCHTTCDGGLKDCGDHCAASCCTTNADCTTPPDPCHGKLGICTTGTCTYGALNGGACNADDNRCTPFDRCQDGACVPDAKPVVCVPLDCKAASCNPVTGDCDYVPRADDTACGGNGCYTAGSCMAGVCSGAALKTCPTSTSVCQVALCDAINGQCVAGNDTNGTQCMKTGLCDSGPTTCQAGTCVAQERKACNSSNECRLSECNDSTGACDERILPDGTPCSGKCTGAASCLAGACACKTDAPGMTNPDQGCSYTVSATASSTVALLLLLFAALGLRVLRSRQRTP